MSALIRQRLLNLSRERNEVFNVVLMRYALERLLYRLARSGHAEDFVLKGAMLFTAWTEKLHRPTKDLDLLGHGNDSGEHLKALFQKMSAYAWQPIWATRGSLSRSTWHLVMLSRRRLRRSIILCS